MKNLPAPESNPSTPAPTMSPQAEARRHLLSPQMIAMNERDHAEVLAEIARIESCSPEEGTSAAATLATLRRLAFAPAVTAAKLKITPAQYDLICDAIDRAKNDDRSEDTDEYAGMILEALNADVEFGK